MKKFSKHIDHVVWVSRPENLAANLERLEKLSDTKLDLYDRKDLGLTVYMSWEAGLELIAPTAEVTEFNQELYQRLESAGEGIFAVIFGVKDIEKDKARLEALGFEVGPELNASPDSPWFHKVVVRERKVDTFMNSMFAIGEIAYKDDVLVFGTD